MSEETTNETNDGSWSGLRKTIIGTLTTVIAGGGVWLSTILFGGHEEPKEEPKTEQAAPAPVIVNVQQNQENKQKVENGGNTIIRERVIEKSPTPTGKVQTSTETAISRHVKRNVSPFEVFEWESSREARKVIFFTLTVASCF